MRRLKDGARDRLMALSIVLSLAIALLAGALFVFVVAVGANTGCPGTDNSFGTQSSTGDCTVDAPTTWGNGTYTLAGNLIVSGSGRLTLWNMDLRLNPSSNQQYRIYVDGGGLQVIDGTLTTANTNFRWRLETSSASGSLVDVDGAAVSYAGGGAYSGFRLVGGTGHWLRNMVVTNSAISPGSGQAVVSLDNGVGDATVENNRFENTGRALYVGSTASGARIAFAGNTITSFNTSGGAGAIYAANAQILNNVVNAGTAPGIEIPRGGGPGWPEKNDYNVSNNEITTTGPALSLLDSQGYDITWNKFRRGQVHLRGSGNYFAYNNVSDQDMRTLPGHVVETSPNSTIEKNTVWNATLTSQSAILVSNYGNVRVYANSLFLRCAGDNCMGIEVINVQEEERVVYPGFPTVEVSWNQVTWIEIQSGTDSAPLDHEFSRRLYIHNNTMYVRGSGRVTELIEVGGARDSVFENNRAYGPTQFCFYQYIYEVARNLFQYNFCRDASYGGIFQTGTNVYRHNVFENVSRSGIWICPDGPCAGSTANATNNVWFNNTFRFRGGLNLTRMSPSNGFYNTFIGHGADQWTEGASGPVHPIQGGWLFFANRAIERVEFENRVDGSRWVRMTVLGKTYWDRDPTHGATNNARLTIRGAIDRRGSDQSYTVLWSLNPSGVTQFNLAGQGTMTVDLSNFKPDNPYEVTFLRLSDNSVSSQVLTMDGSGSGSFSKDFGTTTSRYKITIDEADAVPPSKVSDLHVTGIGPDYVALGWIAPGDDGTTGQASVYDLRYSTTGPVDDTNFAAATPFLVGAPRVAGTAESADVSGLAPTSPYWFALRTADEIPNWSLVSNSVGANTIDSSDVQAPTVTILSPANGTYVSSVVDVTVAATDDQAVQEVRILVDGSVGVVLTGPPYVWTWRADSVASGPHRITAEAYDLAGNRGSAELILWVDNLPPSIEISSPANGSVLSTSTVILAWNATDAGSGVASVMVRLDDGPYVLATGEMHSFVGVGDGAHGLAVKATDGVGLSSAVGVDVTVQAEGENATGGAIGPVVRSVVFVPENATVDITFNEPMNVSSVETAILLNPDLEYELTWTNESHLRVVILDSLQEGTVYQLTVNSSAVDQDGDPLAPPFTFQFKATRNEAAAVPPTVVSALPIAIVLAVLALLVANWATAGFLVMYYRKNAALVKKSFAQFKRRLGGSVIIVVRRVAKGASSPESVTVKRPRTLWKRRGRT